MLLILVKVNGNASAQQPGHARSEREHTSAGYQVGDKADDFKMKDADGKKVSRASVKNTKGNIVEFISNQGPFALDYEDRLMALHQEKAL